MYKDHRKGFNQELSEQARVKLLIQGQTGIKTFAREFDADGNVVRNYKNELDLYVKDEQDNLIPQVGGEYFNAYQKFQLHLKNKNDYLPEIKTIPTGEEKESYTPSFLENIFYNIIPKIEPMFRVFL